MTDWVVWPIFLLELIAFLLFFTRKGARFIGLRYKTIAISILLLCCVLIALSLYHDSTEVLHLHF